MPPEKRDDLEARLDAMSPERWRQINDLLDEVLELPPERRAGDLERRTRGDPELRRDVEALLESHDEADAFLEEPAGSVLPEVEPAPLEGRRIGAYRVIRLVGQGGMGTVYLAEREDVGKRVAVKLLHDGPAAQRAGGCRRRISTPSVGRCCISSPTARPTISPRMG